jgi:hypothetical protein
MSIVAGGSNSGGGSGGGLVRGSLTSVASMRHMPLRSAGSVRDLKGGASAGSSAGAAASGTTEGETPQVDDTEVTALFQAESDVREMMEPLLLQLAELHTTEVLARIGGEMEERHVRRQLKAAEKDDIVRIEREIRERQEGHRAALKSAVEERKQRILEEGQRAKSPSMRTPPGPFSPPPTRAAAAASPTRENPILRHEEGSPVGLAALDVFADSAVFGHHAASMNIDEQSPPRPGAGSAVDSGPASPHTPHTPYSMLLRRGSAVWGAPPVAATHDELDREREEGQARQAERARASVQRHYDGTLSLDTSRSVVPPLSPSRLEADRLAAMRRHGGGSAHRSRVFTFDPNKRDDPSSPRK